MDVLRKLIFMLMSLHKMNAFGSSKPEDIPNFDIQLYGTVHSLFLPPSSIDRKIRWKLYMILFTRLPLMYVIQNEWHSLKSPSRMFVPRISKQWFSPSVWEPLLRRKKNNKLGIFNQSHSFPHFLTYRVFRSSDYLDTLLRIAKPSNSPPSFFSWNEPAGGLSASPGGGWIKNGYTVFCWIRVEAFPKGESRLPV